METVLPMNWEDGTGEMWKNKHPFSLGLNKAISDDIAWQCKYYTGRGVRKHHESGTALVEDMEAPVSKMPDSIVAHCQGIQTDPPDPESPEDCRGTTCAVYRQNGG